MAATGTGCADCNFSGHPHVDAPATAPPPVQEYACPVRAPRCPAVSSGCSPPSPIGLLSLVLPATPAAAADGPSMQAHALLQGHARAGAWFAIAVDVANNGPTVTGELRIAGGLDSRTRFSTPVELATGSRKEYLLYALPLTFGGNMTVELVSADKVVAKALVAVALHDQSQLVVGVVAENPAKVVGQLDLLPNQGGVAPVLVPLAPADLPERIQAWAPLDRLVWQDVDAASLTPGQVSSLRTWIAGGGRLVIVGGTAAADALTGFPDDLLPYRPTGVLDVDPDVLRPVLGTLPDGAKPLTALAGAPGAGRALATSGDRVIAADMAYGSGGVTLLGFDPTTSWIADGDTIDAPLWRRLLPARSGGTVSLPDDQNIVSAVTNLPSLALPPLGGLLVLLVGYIVLVGPVNYLLLRWLDRREWAWITVLVLIAVFTVGAFGIGALIRGSDVILNEIAIVRGAPGTDAAVAQSYLGIFSPTRATYQLRVAGDALLAEPINGDIFNPGDGSVFNGGSGGLDVVQGDPSRVRDLAVGFGSLRTVRAEASAVAPTVTADLHLEDGRIKGTITNTSARTLLAPAFVLGASTTRLKDLGPGASVPVDLSIGGSVNGASLSDAVVGPFDWNGGQVSDAQQRTIIRRAVIDQLSFDPVTGFSGVLPGDAATLLAWGDDPVVQAQVEGAQVRRVANVLYEIPLPFAVHGRTTFRGDLMRSSTVDVNANNFSKDPWTISLGIGDIRMAYRPLPFEGRLTPESVVVGMTFGGDPTIPSGAPAPLKEVARCVAGADGCVPPQDGFPDIEILDIGTGKWVQFAHMTNGQAYELADAARWVDPASGELQVRFVNEHQDGIGFQFQVQLTGTVE